MRTGDAIPGSKLFRCFCSRCGEVMRDTAEHVRDQHHCEACEPHASGCTSPKSPLDSDAYGVATQASFCDG